MKKVRSRLDHSVKQESVVPGAKTYPSGLKEFRSLIQPDCYITSGVANESISFGGYVVEISDRSPISKINFSQSNVEKVTFLSISYKD
jgi:hypothetical protein